MIGRHASTRDYARRLSEVRDDLARVQLEAIERAIPAFHRPGMSELAHAAATAILDSFADLLVHGRLSDVSTPPAVRSFVRCLAWAGVDIDVVGRAYRIGQEKLYDDIREHCRSTCTDVDEAVTLLGELGHLVLRFSDVATGLVLRDFQDECRDLARDPLARRAEVVRAVLDRHSPDLEVVERSLGYRFAGTHTAFRLWTADRTTVGAGLAGVAATLVALVDATGLVVQEEPEQLTVWLAGESAAPREAFLARLRREPAVRAAVGNPGVGADGFRATHRQAVRAAAVGTRPGEQVVRYDDVSLVALLVQDPAAARAFVDEELGGLTSPDEAVLRTTLRSFLDHHCRHLPTARAAHLHRNTVAERIRRVETILGRPVPERAAELLVALRLHDHLGPQTQQRPGPELR